MLETWIEVTREGHVRRKIEKASGDRWSFSVLGLSVKLWRVQLRPKVSAGEYIVRRLRMMEVIQAKFEPETQYQS